MKIGIPFFDDQEPKAGDLWIVASGPAMGKSTVVRNLAVGIAEHLSNGRVAYWDLEHAREAWVLKIKAMRSRASSLLDYRNTCAGGSAQVVSTLNQGAKSSRHALVVIDHFDLFTSDVPKSLKVLKNWLVRSGKMAVVSAQLPRKLWGKLKTEGEINPDAVPDYFLNNANAVFACGQTPQHAVESGVPDSLRVIVCKSSTGLREPHNHKAFIWHHRTGRID